MKAIWNNEVIAETKQTLEIEGKHYFPSRDYCEECSWKGLAKYFDLDVSGKDLPNAVWYYPTPKEDAFHVTGYMAFSEAVQIVN